MGITRAIALPAPVSLGGRGFLASEFRARDYAALVDFVGRQTICPYDAAEPFIHGPPDDPARVILLARTIRAMEEWPPAIDSPEGSAILGSPEGAAFFTLLALRREHPGLTLEDARALVADPTPGDWAKLRRVAWGEDPMAVLMGIVMGPPVEDADAPRPPPLNWVEVKWAYHKQYPGGPPFEELTMTDLSAVLHGGKSPEPGAIVGNLEELTPGQIGQLIRRDEFWDRVAEIEGRHHVEDDHRASVGRVGEAGPPQGGG